MNRILSDEEIRHMLISAMTAPTERDKQVKIGASNLANDCTRCLARDMLGVHYETPRTRRLWMGAWLGTSAHSRVQSLIEGGCWPGALSERHVLFGEIRGYGEVGGTIDIDWGSQIGDVKTATREKLAYFRDFISIQTTGEPIFGRKHKWIAGAGRTMAPESEYAEKLKAAEHKATRGWRQQQLYMLGHGHASQASLIYIARDGNGYFEVPDLDGYDDWTKQHDIFVWSFPFDRSQAEAILARGQDVWDQIEAGAGVSDFEMSEGCFVCADERKLEDATGEPVLVSMERAA